VRPGIPERHTRDCVRHGTTTLFAAPEAAASIGVRDWLARPDNQPITPHFAPASCSWLNLAECFFSVITRQAIRRGTFTPVKELTATIGAFTGGRNEHPRPFT
jgi:hypothetical protein